MKGRRLGLPREGGAYGVWLSGLAYGSLAGPPAGYLGLISVAAALVTLALVGYARGRGAGRLAAIVAPSTLYLYLVYSTAPQSLPLAAVTSIMLALSLRGGLSAIVFGGGLLGSLGGYVALAAGANAIEALVPAVYLLMATGAAGLRVVGPRLEVLAALASGAAATVVAAVALAVTGEHVASLALAADMASRLIGRVSGVEARLKVRHYGFLEAVRTLTVMAVAGASLSPG